MEGGSFRYLQRSGNALRSYSVASRYSRDELISRRLPLAYDYLHPQPSHLLNLTLSGFFPASHSYLQDNNTLPSINSNHHMPVGHHQVYFPPQVPLSQLLPDGTDDLHNPGELFTRRLWAGGRVRFSGSRGLSLRGDRAVCLETVRDITVKGNAPNEKVIVKVEKRIGAVSESESDNDVRDRLLGGGEDEFHDASIIEDKNLVFMRDKTPEQISRDQEQFGADTRVIKAPAGAEFVYPITPTKALLFRFSALTFNAHGIHLDQYYTRDVEGYRNLLVHGPLTLTLLLTAAQSHLFGQGLQIRDIQYRNVAPLFVDEQMKICGKRQQTSSEFWDVWIEGRNDGLAVRGTIQTGK